jgi:hypothetical protein
MSALAMSIVRTVMSMLNARLPLVGVSEEIAST